MQALLERLDCLQALPKLEKRLDVRVVEQDSHIVPGGSEIFERSGQTDGTTCVQEELHLNVNVPNGMSMSRTL